METQTILNTYPADAFSIVAGPGHFFSGGAVAFRPPESCFLVRVILVLRDYDGMNDQQIDIQLLDNQSAGYENRPGAVISSAFRVPQPNDGSIGEFAFDLPQAVSLSGGHVYWLLVHGSVNRFCLKSGALLHWVSGNGGYKNPAYLGSLGFIDGNYLPSKVIPAFTLVTI
jgi:hypothetical protein